MNVMMGNSSLMCCSRRGLSRLAEARALQEQRLIRRWEADTAASEVKVCSVGGHVWTIRVGADATGAELRIRVAALIGAPVAEIEILRGSVKIGDDDCIFGQTCDFDPSHVLSMVRIQRRLGLSGAADGTLRIWDLDTAVCINILGGHTSAVSCVSVDWASRRALSGSWDRTLKLWDLDRSVCIETIRGHDDDISCISANWCMQRAVSGCADGSIIMWNLARVERLSILKGHTDIVHCLDVDWSSDQLISASADQTLKLWNVKKVQQGVCVCDRTFEGHSSPVRSVRVHWGSRRAVSACEAGSVKEWVLDLATCVETSADAAQKGSSNLKRRRTKAKMLKHTLCTWDTDRKSLQEMLHNSTGFRSLSFDSGGRWALTGHSNGEVRLWELHCERAQAKTVKRLLGHQGDVWCVDMT